MQCRRSAWNSRAPDSRYSKSILWYAAISLIENKDCRVATTKSDFVVRTHRTQRRTTPPGWANGTIEITDLRKLGVWYTGTAHSPLHRPTPLSIRYAIPVQETGNALSVALRLRVLMGGGDDILSWLAFIKSNSPEIFNGDAYAAVAEARRRAGPRACIFDGRFNAPPRRPRYAALGVPAARAARRRDVTAQRPQDRFDAAAGHSPRRDHVFPTLLSRASQDDGWLATVSDAPLPLHFMGGASVAHELQPSSLARQPIALTRNERVFDVVTSYHVTGIALPSLG
ncbi:hypothetical protein EVAR_50301_1 [Eumeta japonica]|uniref:Uncharacterized protein n=1 Tax=Eumeta variegata TaxID=151549 RepID=A0A4C1XSH5_EUMVA|nr:hypothetical protein EVAR_50301_1 [Eumeta japonica]